MKGRAGPEAAGKTIGRTGQVKAPNRGGAVETRDPQLLKAAYRDLIRRRQFTSSRAFTIAVESDTCGARCGTAIHPGDRIVHMDGTARHLDCPGRV